MNIILGDDAYQTVKDKYLVLELDTFLIKGEPIKSYCVLDAGDLPLSEMQDLPLWEENHNKIISNWHKGNFEFCEQMIEHAQTRWGGNLRSFYSTMHDKIQDLKDQQLPEGWDGIVVK